MIQKIVLILLLILALMGCTKEPKGISYRVDLKEDTGFNLDTGNERLQFRFIYFFSVDDEGSIYVIDRNTRLVKIDKTGKFQWELNTLGQGPGEFMRITDVCIYKEKILVCDQERKKILTFSKEGKFIDEFKVEKGMPIYIEVDPNGIIYIKLIYPANDTLLQKYNLDGKHIGSIIKKRYHEKEPFLDSAVNGFYFCIDKQNCIILAYFYEYTLDKYDSMGKLLQEWTRKLPYEPVKPRLVRPSPNQMEIKGSLVIQDIDVDEQDRIYVLWGCRGTNHGMQVDLFSTDGVLMSEFFTGRKPLYDDQKISLGKQNDFYLVNSMVEPNIYRFNISVSPVYSR